MASQPATLLQEWMQRINDLISEVADWSRAQGWTVQTDRQTIQELGSSYEVPTLRVILSEGELLIHPIALQVFKGKGRIDIEAFPTLNRVKMFMAGNEWQILTDSNVPLYAPWNRETFVRLAKDLLAAT